MEEVTKFEHADFITHANYVEFMQNLSSGLSLQLRLTLSKRMKEQNSIRSKIGLIKLTLKNLYEEYKNIQKYPEYSIVCTSWIPVKSYYLLFNLISIIEYLIFGQDKYLKFASHAEVSKIFKDLIKFKKLEFNKKEFNETYYSRSIIGWKIPPWENVKRKLIDPGIRLKQIIKKLLEYKREDFKLREKLKRLSGSKKEEFLKMTSINLIEFFYWYRIKANYRDMEFINKDVPVGDFKSFYDDYYFLTINFYKAFKDSINNLSKIRFNKNLLN